MTGATDASASNTGATASPRPEPQRDAAPSGQVVIGPHDVPRQTPGTALLGEYEGSGFVEPHYIAQRPDGQVLQLSRLLHLVASEIDGRRTIAELAEAVGARAGRKVTADDVGYLLVTRLVPAGVVAVPGAATTPAPRVDLLLDVRLRGTLLPGPWVERVGSVLSGLHRLPVVLAVLGSWVVAVVWLFASQGVVSSLLAVLKTPSLLLAVAGLTVLSLLFHELGHASACCFGGGRPGRIGYGIYLVWPALYTDVTDVYRLSRAARLRTDLGGVYFNVVFILAMVGCYAATAEPVFLAVAYVCHFQILDQLLPIVRFDGYFVLGDLVGVPDLFGKVRPVLAGLLPGRGLAPQVAGLRRRVRVVVTVWVLVTVPLLVANLGYAVWKLPDLLRTAALSFARQMEVVAEGVRTVDPLAVGSGALSALLLLLPSVGLVYLLARIARRLVRRLPSHVRALLRWLRGVRRPSHVASGSEAP